MPNSNIPKYLRSDPNAICDTCGRKRKWSEVVHSYGTGDLAVIISCRDGCADERHPLNDPPPVIFDGQPVIDARPEPATTYLVFQNVPPVTWNSNTYQFGPSTVSDFSFDPPYNDGVNWEST